MAYIGVDRFVSIDAHVAQERFESYAIVLDHGDRDVSGFAGIYVTNRPGFAFVGASDDLAWFSCRVAHGFENNPFLDEKERAVYETDQL